MLRSPAVANQFYPGSPAALTEALEQLVPKIAAADKQPALAVVSPHAGYIYSGGVAGETFARLTIPKDIIILGPNHHGYGASIALMNEGAWDMPLGEVPVNETLAAICQNNSDLIKSDEVAHRFEHSLEVQVPFLQFLQPDISITPIVLAHISLKNCQQLGKDLAASIKEYGKPVLIVASSDMTHYESRTAATKKDRLAIDQILELDAAGLYGTVTSQGITMCGIMPATVALVAACELGARKAELIRYTDSGETSGDTRQVVGYAGIIIS